MLSFLVIDFSFHYRYLIEQLFGLSLQLFFLGLHLPLNSLLDGNMVLPEKVQGLKAPAFYFLVGRFTHFLELLTLGVDLLIEIPGLRVDGFNDSDSVGFKHLFHLCSDVARQGIYLVRQP